MERGSKKGCAENNETEGWSSILEHTKTLLLVGHYGWWPLTSLSFHLPMTCRILPLLLSSCLVSPTLRFIVQLLHRSPASCHCSWRGGAGACAGEVHQGTVASPWASHHCLGCQVVVMGGSGNGDRGVFLSVGGSWSRSRAYLRNSSVAVLPVNWKYKC